MTKIVRILFRVNTIYVVNSYHIYLTSCQNNISFECINQYTCFKTNTSMRLVRFHIITVTCRKNFFPIANSQFKLAACNISSLAMIMLMHRTDGTFLKFHFHHHQLPVLPHYLAADSRSRFLPIQFFLKLKSITACFHLPIYSYL